MGKSMIDWRESSSTFRDVHETGERVGLRKILMRLGTKRFGTPTTTTVALIDAIEEVELLQSMIERVMDANGWGEVVPIEWRSTEIEGIVHGGMIVLDDEKALPKGTRVRISSIASNGPRIPPSILRKRSARAKYSSLRENVSEPATTSE